jgi:hypothetical protein
MNVDLARVNVDPQSGPRPSQDLDAAETKDVGGVLHTARRYAFGCVLDYLDSHPDCDRAELLAWLKIRMNGM